MDIGRVYRLLLQINNQLGKQDGKINGICRNTCRAIGRVEKMEEKLQEQNEKIHDALDTKVPWRHLWSIVAIILTIALASFTYTRQIDAGLTNHIALPIHYPHPHKIIDADDSGDNP